MSEDKKMESQETPSQMDESSFLDLHWTDEDPDLDIAPEGVCCKDINEIVERIAKVKDTVKKINLLNQHALTEIPSIFKECKLLEELNISHSAIKEIPDFLFTLPNLRGLSCCCRELIRPPTGFANAKKLERLHFRFNEDWEFPKGITALNELKTLAIDIYSVIALPKDMGNLKNLEELTLFIKYEQGDAPCLPSSFKDHGAIKKFNIGDHVYKNHKTFDLDQAAKILASCPGLESVKIAGFSIGKGHESLSLFTGLKELELRHLSIEGNLFNSITALKKLEKLHIWGSEFKITEFPDILGNLKELQSLSFAGNFILDLPPSIYGLSKLTALEIGSTGITALDEKIGKLQNLEKIHIYDNMIQKLPESIFTLPSLAVLDIEDNIFQQEEIAAIKEKLAALEKNGKKIEFMCEGQGHRQMVKRLRTLKDIAAMDMAVYSKHCLGAINENAFALKYVDKKKLHGSLQYAELCMAAVRKSCSALEEVDPEMLEKTYYFRICIEATRNPELDNVLKYVKDKLLTDYEYIQVCIEAALHNNSVNFLDVINQKSYMKRLSRGDYERVCWVAILRYPAVISKMIDPTLELRQLAAKHGHEKKR